MGAIEVNVDVIDVVLALREMAERAALGLAPAKDELTQAAREAFARVFETSGSFGGSPWEELSEATMRRYDRSRWGDDALGGRGGVWESLTSDGPGSLDELSDDGRSLTVGTTDPVAAFFDRGTSRGQPPRPFFPDGELPPEVVAQVEEIIERYLTP